MESLVIKISFKSDYKNIITYEKNGFDNGKVKINVIRAHNTIFDEKSIFYNNSKNVLCIVLGYISNIEEIRTRYSFHYKNDVEVVEKLYSLKKLEFISELYGIFLIFIFDRDIQRGYLTQSELGFNLPIYYVNRKDEFLLSTSLKEILKHTQIKRELNMSAVYNLLYHRTIIPNESTLIKNVNKLLPRLYFEINFNTNSIQKNTIPIIKKKKIPFKTAKKNLLNSIRINIKNLSEQLLEKDITLTLTAGFDTNIILYFLKKLTKHSIKAITIDGGGKTSEVSIVMDILNHYSINKYEISKIEESIVNSLPDIVWRVEGYLFDEGLFLRYILSKTIKKNNSTTVFIGSSADQLMFTSLIKIRKLLRFFRSIYYLLFRKAWEQENIRKSFKKFINNDMRNMHNYNLSVDCNMKLHEILLNSFGIKGMYPFVNNNTADLCKALGLANRNKKIYKAAVTEKLKSIFTPELLEKIKKSGSVIDIKHIFLTNKSLLMKVVKSGFVKNIFTKKQHTKILTNPDKYYSLIIQLAYIYLFNELFISGKYDLKFGDNNFNTLLSELV